MEFLLKLLAGAIRVTIPIAYAALAGVVRHVTNASTTDMIFVDNLRFITTISFQKYYK